MADEVSPCSEWSASRQDRTLPAVSSLEGEGGVGGFTELLLFLVPLFLLYNAMRALGYSVYLHILHLLYCCNFNIDL